MKQNITLNKHFKQAVTLLIIALVIPTTIILRGTEMNVLIISCVIFSISALPAVILHFRYWYLNKSLTLSNKTCFVTDNNRNLLTNKREIKCVQIYMPISVYFGKIRFFPAANYYYGVISLITDEKIVITSLLDPELEWLKSIAPNKTELRIKFYCWC